MEHESMSDNKGKLVYIVVVGSGSDDLVEKVNDLLDQGYKCQGGVSAIRFTTDEWECYRFFQAMVLEAEDDVSADTASGKLKDSRQ